MKNIIGRKKEIEELERLYNAENAEFVAVYGRRRVGKTYLIKEVFKDRFAFWHTGLSPYDHDKKFLLRDQLQAFLYSLQDFGYEGQACPKSWLEAFRWLEKLLASKDDGSRQVVFIDELPWMDTARSRFIPAFEHFWNGWASKRDNILLIVCGSATSWMEDNLINNKGGLYNRLTREIKLCPFTLAECEAYFRNKEMNVSRYDVAQTYMVFGGVPHYLSLFEKGYSTAQNIDLVLFDGNAKLRNEFDRLFGSLFKNADDHKKVVRLLAGRRSGYTRKEILELTAIKDGGGASEILKGLKESDFITSYYPFGGGFAFEELCFAHIAQIKQKLGIASVSTTESSWVVESRERKHQIDLLIDRADNVINLCEIKFYGKSFSIDAKYGAELRERVQTLMDKVLQKKSIHLTLIAAYGLKPNENSGQVQSVVSLDDLF